MALLPLLLLLLPASAVADAEPLLPRLFPPPSSVQLSPPAETVALSPCGFALSRAGYWGSAASGPSGLWPEPPETALEIYRPLILRSATCGAHDAVAGGLGGLAVLLNPSPSAGESVEGYTIQLQAGADAAVLVVSSYAGLLRGLETFSQLVTVANPQSPSAELRMRLPATVSVRDAPSFGTQTIRPLLVIWGSILGSILTHSVPIYPLIYH